MNHLDLFSGIGGFSLSARWAWGAEHNVVFFIEKDSFCQKVLAKHWPGVPIHDDIFTFRGTGPIDLLTGGFPCQPFSMAGKQAGTDDDRYLWPEMARVIAEAKPHWIIAENVPGIIGMALDDVLADLEGQGYETGTLVIPACATGAIHRRDRVWIVAHANESGSGRQSGDAVHERRTAGENRGTGLSQTTGRQNGVAISDDRATSEISANSERGRRREQLRTDTEWQSLSATEWAEGALGFGSGCETICNAAISGLPDWAGGTVGRPAAVTEFERSDGREVERDFRGVAHVVSRRVDRLRALGNAIVPTVAYQIMLGIKEQMAAE